MLKMLDFRRGIIATSAASNKGKKALTEYYFPFSSKITAPLFLITAA